MPEPGPAPLQSLLGGVGLAFPVQTLLSLNGNTFGISGFIHGAARGNLEDVLSVLGMIAGGFAVGAIEGIKPTIQDSPALPLILSGLLVGAGAKVRLKCAKVSVRRHVSSVLLLAHRWVMVARPGIDNLPYLSRWRISLTLPSLISPTDI